MVFLLLYLTASVYPGSTGREGFLLPVGKNRSPSYQEFKRQIIGKFGEYRKSNVPGHKHSGIDIKAGYSEPVYSIGNGRVTEVFGDFPNKTVIIEHRGEGGKQFYSAYIHLEEIKIKSGDMVSGFTRIGRIFNKKEHDAAGFGTLPHIHLEIRTDISDKGKATYNTMTKKELNKYFENPEQFYKAHLKGEKK